MGFFISKFQICVIGNTNAGKNELCKSLKTLNNDTETESEVVDLNKVPTSSFNKFDIWVPGSIVELWCTGGTQESHVHWTELSALSDAIIFVVDLTEETTWMSSLNSLQVMISDILKHKNNVGISYGKPLFIVCTKIDLIDDLVATKQRFENLFFIPLLVYLNTSCKNKYEIELVYTSTKDLNTIVLFKKDVYWSLTQKYHFTIRNIITDAIYDFM